MEWVSLAKEKYDTAINEIQDVFLVLWRQNTEFRACGAVASVHRPTESGGIRQYGFKYLRRPDKNEHEKIESI